MNRRAFLARLARAGSLAALPVPLAAIAGLAARRRRVRPSVEKVCVIATYYVRLDRIEPVVLGRFATPSPRYRALSASDFGRADPPSLPCQYWSGSEWKPVPADFVAGEPGDWEREQ